MINYRQPAAAGSRWHCAYKKRRAPGIAIKNFLSPPSRAFHVDPSINLHKNGRRRVSIWSRTPARLQQQNKTSRFGPRRRRFLISLDARTTPARQNDEKQALALFAGSKWQKKKEWHVQKAAEMLFFNINVNVKFIQPNFRTYCLLFYCALNLTQWIL